MAIGGILNFSGTSLTIGNSVFDYNSGTDTIGQSTRSLLPDPSSGPDTFGRVSISLVPTYDLEVPASFSLAISSARARFSSSRARRTRSATILVAWPWVRAPTLVSSACPLSPEHHLCLRFEWTGRQLCITLAAWQPLAETSPLALSGATSAAHLAINDGTNFVANQHHRRQLCGRCHWPRHHIRYFYLAIPQRCAFAFQLYLDGNGNALQLGADTLEVTTGPAYLKTATSN